MRLGIIQGRLLNPETNHIQSFPNKYWKKEFKIAASNNINLIEWIVDRKNIFKNPINTNKGRAQIKYLKRKYKIEIDSLTAEFYMQKPFTREKNNTENEFKILKRTLSNSGKINVKYFIIPILESASLKKEDEELFLKKMKLLINILKKNKQIILFETDIDILRIVNLLTKLPKKYFGINFDTGNSINIGYSFKDIQILIKHTHNIHLKDKNDKFLSVKLGSGLFNFRKFFNLLKKEKYNKNLILQTARTTSDHVNDIKKNKKFVEKFIKIN